MKELKKNKKERLDKILAHMGYGTRKDIKKAMKKGIVTVDGEVVTDSAHTVDPAVQNIAFMGESVCYKPFVYLLHYKREGTVCSHNDTHSVLWDIEGYDNYDLHTVGRLDRDTTGLLLVTNDGRFTHHIISPKHAVQKVYRVHADGALDRKALEKIRTGVRLEDGDLCRPAQIEHLGETDYRLTLTEGKYHQVKRMFEAVGRRVLTLHREKLGALNLDGLSVGQTRELTEEEYERLIRSAPAQTEGEVNSLD